jgi:hypothetical protein
MSSRLRPACLVVCPHVHETWHLVPVASLPGPIGLLIVLRFCGRIRWLSGRFRGSVRAHRLVDTAAFVRVGQFASLWCRPVSAARADALRVPGLVRLARQVQEPHSAPIRELNVIKTLCYVTQPSDERTETNDFIT